MNTCIRPLWISISFLLIFLFYGQSGWSVPASPDSFYVYQPDGTPIEVQLKGDEYQHWVETTEGYSVQRSPQNNIWYYVEYFIGKRPVLTQFPADQLPPRMLKKHIKPIREVYLEGSEDETSDEPSMDRSLPQSEDKQSRFVPEGVAPIVMSGKVLFILVQYQDTPFTYPAADWASFLSDDIADFFNTASSGKVNLTPALESHGTADDGVVGWLTVSRDYPYNPGIQVGLSTSDRTALVQYAIEEADAFVDYASYDENGDGFIDADELAITIVVAGYERAYGGGTYTPAVWGHKSSISPVTVDGVLVGAYHNRKGGYAMFGEVQRSTETNGHQATMGIMVHELGHLIFGFPDLYDTDGSSSGIGAFCVMSGGSWGRSSDATWSGETPVMPCASIKYQAGWAAGSSLCGTQSITASGATTANFSNTVFRAKTNNFPNDTQYFLVENRQPIGYDRGLERYLGTSFGGLAIFHVDDTQTDNEDDDHRWVDLEEADGIQLGDSSGSAAKLWFNGQSANPGGFTASSTPDSDLYSGSASQVSLTDISTSGEIMTAVLAAGSGYCLPDTILLYEDFDRTIPPPGWSIVDNSGSGKEWLFNNIRGNSNQTAGSGNFADADGAYYYFDLGMTTANDMDTAMLSPFFNPTGHSQLTLSFKSYLLTQDSDTANVDIRCSGDNWQWHNIWSKEGTFSYPGVTDEPQIDISSSINGSTGCQIRFRYIGWVHQWQVDDIMIGGPLSQTQYNGNNYTLPADQWRLIGLPRNPGNSNTIKDLLADDLTEAQYDVRWAVFGRDKATSTNIKLALNTALTGGEGYWIMSYDGGELDLPGIPQTPVYSTDCPQGCFEIPLVKGVSTDEYRYNMLGNPFAWDVNWSDIKIKVTNSGSSTIYTPNAAETAGYSSKTIYTYNGSAYQAYDDITPGMLGTLTEFDGFFFKVVSGSIVDTYDTITMLVPAASLTTSSPSPSMRDKAASQKGWYVRLIATDSENDLIDSGNVLGQLTDSSYQYDSHDLEELAPMGETFLTVVFPHAEWLDYPGDYTSDYHPFMGAGDGRRVDQWDFEVRTNDPTRTVTLSWEGLPKVFRRSRLIDVETGEMINVNKVKQYTFTMSDTSRQFTWKFLNKR